jgi:N6-L-threonylcarbamoyladenine synthase
MIILSIETSCDDTGVSIIKTNSTASLKRQISFNDFEVLADMISSQAKLHAEYGGVFPSLAKREHQKNLVPLLVKALKKAKFLKKNTKKVDGKKIKKIQKELERNAELFSAVKVFLEDYGIPEINKIAVTIGPGLEPCLWTGVNLARALSTYWEVPVAGINHLEGHLLANWLAPVDKVAFPAMALVVSGGNTQIILMKNIGEYELVGETRDDAAGECFDKTARILGLGYPGGPSISKQADKFAREGKSDFNISLPRPMIHEKNYDFSFSGLKTAVLYDFQKRTKKDKISPRYVQEMSYQIERAIIEVLISKTMKAAKDYGVKSVIIGGGVSANKKLVREFKKECRQDGLAFFSPLPAFSGDNASMIGLTAAFSKNAKTISFQKIKPDSNLKING